MENKKESIRPVTWIIVGVAVIFIAGYFGLQLYQGFQRQMLESVNRSKEQEDLLSKQQEELEQAKKEIDDIKNQKPQIVIKQGDPPAITGTQNNPPSLSTIIAKWRPRIAYIECELRYANTGKLYAETAGSGILYKVAIFSNKHVVDNAYTCYAMFPDSDNTYTFLNSESNIRVSHYGYDWGILTIKQSEVDNYITNLLYSNFEYCKTKASLGDEVVILGYPTIGSQYDITATRGIVSGYDGDYYITDAKIEHGNSGGAAILVKDNCYLGIPTYVLAGEVESLARILDARIIFDSNK